MNGKLNVQRYTMIYVQQYEIDPLFLSFLIIDCVKDYGKNSWLDHCLKSDQVTGIIFFNFFLVTKNFLVASSSLLQSEKI